MDQLKKAWAWFVQHHFWVLIVVAIGVAIFCWYSGATTLAEQFASNKQKIEQQFNAISQLRNTPFKPNQSVKEKQQEQINIQQKAVRELWQELYNRQRADVLKWPANLSSAFRNKVEQLQFGAEIQRDLRDHYNNYVRDHFPNLPKIVGAAVAAEGSSGRSRGNYGPRGMAGRGEFGDDRGRNMEEFDDTEYMVEWEDQDIVRQQLYMPSTPTSKRIWKTQEDLWVYEALLKIIAATNEAAGADRFSNAAVRVIETMEVGQPAAQKSRTKGRIAMVEPSGAAGGGFGDPYGGGDMGGMGGRGGFGGEMGGEFDGGFGGEFRGPGMGTGDSGDAELFANRYIGPDGQPMSSEPPPTEAFKRLPIRMQLWMDERWLPQLIAECANAPLQVEVQEVRINPNESGSRGRGRVMPNAGETMVPEAEPHMKTVIVQGIIYIFNPPPEAAEAGQVAGLE